MIRQKSFENKKPTLFLVATPIGNLSEMTYRAVETLKSVQFIAAEDTRNTIKLLNHFNITTKLISHHEHNIVTSIPKIIQLLQDGYDIALVSDAGYPAISDPGYELVKEVISNGYNVVPIFYEAPHRIKKTLNHMLNIFGNRNIALCREITKKYEEINRGSIEEILTVVDDMKGEMVIVVEGCHESTEEVVFEQSIEEHVSEYIAKGMSTKDAIKEVSKQRKISKNIVYQEYHKK